MTNEKPEVLGHPDDAAEEWLAEEFEEDHSTVGVAYERSQMIDAFHAGSDWARRQIAKFGKDADGRWITHQPDGPGTETTDAGEGEDMEGEHIVHHIRDPKGDEDAHG